VLDGTPQRDAVCPPDCLLLHSSSQPKTRHALEEIVSLNLLIWQDHGTFEVLLPRRAHSQSRAKQVLFPWRSC
jgi:hypothetical protein